MFKYTFEDDFVLFNSEKLTENIVYLTERVGTDAREEVNMAAAAEVALLCKSTGSEAISTFKSRAYQCQCRIPP
jgi:hypothetical protein